MKKGSMRMRHSLLVSVSVAALLFGIGCKDEYRGPRPDGGGGGFDGGGFSSGDGSLPFTGECIVFQELFLSPDGGSTTVNGNTSGNGNTAQATCGGRATGPDQTFLLQVPSSGRLVLTITEGSHDTVLHMGTSCRGSEVACDDDGAPTRLLSRIETSVSAGSYYVVADGYDSADAGSYTLQIDYVPSF